MQVVDQCTLAEVGRERSTDEHAETRRAEAERCDEAGELAGETVPNQKTAGGARANLLAWLAQTAWVDA